MSEFYHDPYYHHFTEPEKRPVTERVTEVGGIIVDTATMVFQGIADVARKVLHHSNN
jgi:hypothetical protein